MNFIKDERFGRSQQGMSYVETDENGHETLFWFSKKEPRIYIYGEDKDGEENTYLTIKQLEYILNTAKKHYARKD